MSFRTIIKFLIVIMILQSSALADDNNPIPIDTGLLEQSDYLDIAYINDKYAYVIYQTADSLYKSINPPFYAPMEIHEKDVASLNTTQPLSTWIWDYREAIENKDKTINKLLKSNIKRIYLQVNSDDIESFRPLVSAAVSKGIEVYALDGNPYYIDDFIPLLKDIDAIKRFNAVDKKVQFAGFQADVEPYIKPDFNLRATYYAYRYITLINTLKREMGLDLKLSVAIPFWYDTLMIDGVEFSNRVIDNVDEVVIMSYRTAYGELIDSAASELAYAKKVGKPVYLGVETSWIEDEKHFVIERKTIKNYLQPGSKGATLSKTPENGLPVYKTYYVKADLITFCNHRDKVGDILKKQPDIGSFRGYVVHSYESYIRNQNP